jgi:hypothetical protein
MSSPIPANYNLILYVICSKFSLDVLKRHLKICWFCKLAKFSNWKILAIQFFQTNLKHCDFLTENWLKIFRPNTVSFEL